MSDEPETKAGRSRRKAMSSEELERLILTSMAPATVAATADVTSRLRLITVRCEALKAQALQLGQKVQITTATILTVRTFTPISLDAAAGEIQFLVYHHGGGPGSEWAAGVRCGAGTRVFGPRDSLDLSEAGAPLVLAGDETSIGLSMAVLAARPDLRPIHLFEVSDEETRQALPKLGLARAEAFVRQQDDRHLAVLSESLGHLASDEAHFVLTGRAQAIQAMHKTLHELQVPSSRVRSKAYWSPGKKGLD